MTPKPPSDGSATRAEISDRIDSVLGQAAAESHQLWRVWLSTIAAILLGTGVVGWIHHQAIDQAIHTWLHSEAHQFSLLVLPIAFYLIWQRRSRLLQEMPAPTFWPLLIIIPFSLVWLVSDAVHFTLGAQISTMGMLQALVLSILGWRAYKVLLFPLLFLWLLVPFGDSLTPYLMRLTTHLTAAGLTLAGLDVSTDGNIVISEAGRVGIVEDCSALDFVIGNVVISLVFANLVYSKISKRFAYVLVSIPVAILANNLRTTSVILITYWSDNEWDLLSDHRFYGWVLFSFCIALQMAVGARFCDPRESQLQTPSIKPRGHGARRTKTYAVLMTAIVVISAGPAYAALLKLESTPPLSSSLCAPAWLSPIEADKTHAWRPVFLGAQSELYAQQVVHERSVDFYVAYYWRQNENAEMVGWPNEVYDGKIWHFLERRSVVARVDEQTVKIWETRLRGPERSRRLTWNWYWIDGRIVSSPAIAKLLQARAALLGGDRRAAAIVLSTGENNDLETARRAMQSLIGNAAFLTRMLEEARPDADDSMCQKTIVKALSPVV